MLRRVFAGAGVCAVMSATWAVESVWQGGDGTFSDPSKWSSAAVPGEEDAVRFDVAGAAAVSFTQDATVSNAVVDAAQNAPLTFDLGGNRWTVKDRFQFPASSQSGVVTLQNGLLSCLGNEVLLSLSTQTQPSALVFGTGAASASRNLTVHRAEVRFEEGQHGVTNLLWIAKGGPSDSQARVKVEEGASVSTWQLWAGSDARSTGVIEVAGGSLVVSNNFSLGDSHSTAVGLLSVSGGFVNLRGAIWIGNAYAAQGIVNQSGGTIYVTGGNAEFGHRMGGTGRLNLSGGSFICANTLTAGNFENQYVSATGTLDLVGGTLIVSNTLQVGRGTNSVGTVWVGNDADVRVKDLNVGGMGTPLATGSISVTGGVVETRGTLWLGSAAGSQGTLSVSAGAVTNLSTAYVGDTGTGTLAVAGGTVRLAGTTTVGNQATGVGMMSVSGGSCETAELFLGNNGGTGTVSVSGGALTLHNNVSLGNTVGSSGTWTQSGGIGTLRGTTTVGVSGAGKLTVSGGTLNLSNALNCGANAVSAGYLALAGGQVNGKGGEWGQRGVSLIEISGGTNAFGEIFVGTYTQATLRITGGSNTFSNLRVARNNAGSSALFRIEGGQTSVPGYLDIGQAGPGLFEMAGGELTVNILRMNPGTTVSPVPPQSEIRMTGGRLWVTNETYYPDTASITSKLTLAGGVFAVPNLRQHHGKLHVLFDGGTLEATKSDASFIRALDAWALTSNGLVVDTAGFTCGTALVLPDAAGEQGRVVKKGAGAFTLNAVNTFTGPVVVEAGTLALGSGGLITLAGGCDIGGGALLNLSARALDFTLPNGTVSRVDGELRLADGQTLTVASGATLGGTGTVGRVLFSSGAVLARNAAQGTALLHADACEIPAGAVLALTGFSAAELRQGITVVAAASLQVAPAGSVSVTLDGVPQSPVALRVSGGTLTATSYNPGTLIQVN